jgi:hypothetical protein
MALHPLEGAGHKANILSCFMPVVFVLPAFFFFSLCSCFAADVHCGNSTNQNLEIFFTLLITAHKRSCILDLNPDSFSRSSCTGMQWVSDVALWSRVPIVFIGDLTLHQLILRALRMHKNVLQVHFTSFRRNLP